MNILVQFHETKGVGGGAGCGRAAVELNHRITFQLSVYTDIYMLNRTIQVGYTNMYTRGKASLAF
jgi:hypothetical protein